MDENNIIMVPKLDPIYESREHTDFRALLDGVKLLWSF